MAEAAVTPELPTIVSLIAGHLPNAALREALVRWENVIFSLLLIGFLSAVAFCAGRKKALVPGRLQALLEMIVGGIDDFVCGMLGPEGRRYTPFIGTLFIYILCANLMGIIPFLKSPTSSLSMTLALSLCVFVYVQYSAFKSLGVRGYLDHLLGRPRGVVAFSVVIPALMFFMHVIGELVKPVTLSLRLRSNVWGDDMLLAVVAGFGLGGVPLYVFSMCLTLIAAVVQAVVFCLLTTIYFAFVLTHDEAEEETGKIQERRV